MSRPRAPGVAIFAGVAILATLLSVPFAMTGALLSPSRADARVTWLALMILHSTWCGVEAATVARHRGDRVGPAGRPRWLPHAIALAGVALVAAAAIESAWRATPVADAALRGAFGLLAGGLGLGLRIAAIRRLGPRFLDQVAIGPEPHAIERGGIFARMRHPAEGGFLLLTLSTTLVAGSVAAALIWVAAVLPLVARRIDAEDRLLLEHFGDQARSYRQRVRAFGLGRRRRMPAAA